MTMDFDLVEGVEHNRKKESFAWENHMTSRIITMQFDVVDEKIKILQQNLRKHMLNIMFQITKQ